MIWAGRKQKYFFAGDWTTQISLRLPRNFDFTRSEFKGSDGTSDATSGENRSTDLPDGQSPPASVATSGKGTPRSPRVAAIRQLNVSKSSFDFAWIDAIEKTDRHDWYEPMRRRLHTKTWPLPYPRTPNCVRRHLVGIGGAEQCRLLGAKRKTCARFEVYSF